MIDLNWTLRDVVTSMINRRANSDDRRRVQLASPGRSRVESAFASNFAACSSQLDIPSAESGARNYSHAKGQPRAARVQPDTY